MPEIVEYVKLQRQLSPAWAWCQLDRISAPSKSPNPKKYVQGDFAKFREALRLSKIYGIERYGKMLYVALGPAGEFGYCYTWQIHLSSTGWFMPHNELAKEKANVNPIHRNFLHGINDGNVRLRLHFTDGQTWNYHDSRTWGKWWLRAPTYEWGKEYGPDWLLKPREARRALVEHQSKRTAKDVLCDQHVTAGLGNYLACETLWRANIHPHTRWHLVTPRERDTLTEVVELFLQECMARGDHGHWTVFDKAGEPCPRHPGQPIGYAKDGTNGKRGSYFCHICQERRP